MSEMASNISFVDRDMFSIPADVLVNTVNCVGVMGAGVAATFKHKYPEMYKDYVGRCRRRELKPGSPYLWQYTSMFDDGKQELIINFPTKDNWRDPSEYKYIEDGLVRMRSILTNMVNRTVVMPALGCGHGGLDWARVQLMIINALQGLPTNVIVTIPKNSQISNSLTEKEKTFMANKSIGMLSPSDSDYPSALKGRSSAVLYYRGDINWVNDAHATTILNSNVAEQPEMDVVRRLLDGYKNQEKIVVLRVRSMSDMDVLKECLMHKIKVIMLIPTGIMHMKLRPDVKELWDDKLILLISTQSPDKEYHQGAAAQIMRLQILIGNKLIVTMPQTRSLYYNLSDLQRKDVGYIQYQGANKQLEEVGARPIQILTEDI